jgi:ribosomal protein S1
MKKQDFASLLEESFKKRKGLEPGVMYEVKVTAIKEDYTFVETIKDNLKGIISNSELTDSESKLEIGKNYELFFLREDHGDYYFTSALSGDDIHSNSLLLALEKQIPVLGQFSTEVPNGYEIKLGETIAFCPFSQIDPDWKGKNLQGKKTKFIIQEINSKSKKLILSQKKISDKEKLLKKEILKDQLEVGSYVTCRVKSIHNFGLIVDMNGLDALVPASETSFKKNVDISKEFKEGDTLRGKILNLDWKENKFSITLKDSSNDPWSKQVPYKEGDIVKGTIDSIKPFGLFIKLDDTFHGLVPNKETGIQNRAPLNNHFKIGESIEVFVLEVNPEKKQIALSVSKAKEAHDRMDYESYLSTQKVESVSSFGLLLKKSLKK